MIYKNRVKAYFVSQFGRNNNFYLQLMLGEWLNEIPDDFSTEWVMIPCPKGRRALVVASNVRKSFPVNFHSAKINFFQSVTKAYSKNGFFVRKYQSILPGGGSKCEGKSSLYTLLDCFFDNDSKCYYALDVMSWNGIDMLNCEVSFTRTSWLGYLLWQEHEEAGPKR